MDITLDQLSNFATHINTYGKRTVERYFKLLRNTSNFDTVLNEIDNADMLMQIREVDDNLRNLSPKMRERLNKRIQFLVS